MRCSYCGKRAYSDYCVQHKPRKPIRKRGKKTLEYEAWRDAVAKPYLDEHFGKICAACGGARCHNKLLDVDHIQNRGSSPQAKMDLGNVQYLGRFPCHYEKTNNIREENNVLDKSTKLV